ncbi:MAG: insulinase family protein, partial [Pyrinomonadaceae bacterium]
IIFLPQPGDGKVSLQLRIHSGAAFDPAGKSGVMALLGDSLFPEPETNNFFEDELGGTLVVDTDYDSINVTMTGNTGEVARMVDALKAALVDAPFTDEHVAKLKAERVAAVKKLTRADLADQAVAERLLGSFPYGRPVGGNAESLAKIDRIDLMVARDKFLNPNNATLVVGGTFDKSRIQRTFRQQLGVWRRSDRVVPSTFRQAEPPDQDVLLIPNEDPGTEVRLAVRGLARSDADYPVSLVLAVLANNFMHGATFNSVGFARFEAHVLPGLVMFGGHSEMAEPEVALKLVWERAVKPLMEAPPTVPALDAAKGIARATLSARQGAGPGAGGLWLDSDTYGVGDPAKQLRAVENVTATDVQRVANRLFKNAPAARIAFADVELAPETGGKPASATKTDVPAPATSIPKPMK